MRILTWNCNRGPVERKLALVATLGPTVSVVQECPKPKQDDPSLLWFGDNARQGIAVVASPGCLLAPFPTRDAPRFVIPVQVTGPVSFLLLWDYKRPSHLSHSGLVRSLASFGLVSAYHRFFGEEQGVESRPTLHMLKRRERPYHIDYCFIPESWGPSIRSVEVGTYETWIAASDHCPLVVDIALPPTASPGGVHGTIATAPPPKQEI